ncbi:hypothetical protein LC2W_2075 [Lacticaseibacillus paracasei]|nr:hypothetical protein LC2W_2075 [Lacticaseibacillus paracasei]KTE97289.1 hypothetical protein AC564_2940 [Lacticaseibacillus paracasei]
MLRQMVLFKLESTIHVYGSIQKGDAAIKKKIMRIRFDLG